MKTLYEFIGAAPDAAPEVISKRIENTRLHLQQIGRITEGDNTDRLRQAKAVLLNPTERARYDRKLAVENPVQGDTTQPQKKQARGKHTSTVSVIVLVVLVAGFIAGVLLYYDWDNLVHWPDGVYLVSNATGEVSAVLVTYEGQHDFSNGRLMTAYEVKILNTGKYRWLGVKQLHAEFSKGSPAPPSVWKEPGNNAGGRNPKKSSPR